MIRKQNEKNYNGFTLIELLVVVLIIGILAAVALPQYKHIVLKSRYSTVKNNVKALYLANQRYYLANSKYTTRIMDLDINISDPNPNNHYYTNANGSASCNISIETATLYHYIYPDGIRRLCMFSSEDKKIFDILDNFCKKETNTGASIKCNNPISCYYFY